MSSVLDNSHYAAVYLSTDGERSNQEIRAFIGQLIHSTIR